MPPKGKEQKKTGKVGVKNAGNKDYLPPDTKSQREPLLPENIEPKEIIREHPLLPQRIFPLWPSEEVQVSLLPNVFRKLSLILSLLMNLLEMNPYPNYNSLLHSQPWKKKFVGYDLGSICS
jgi:hypothetical protein